jgi:hypothetical protein
VTSDKAGECGSECVFRDEELVSSDGGDVRTAPLPPSGEEGLLLAVVLSRRANCTVATKW